FASLRSHGVRLAMTALAVAPGTGLMAGSFVFTATLTHSLDSLFAQAATGTDVEVRHVSPAGAVQGAGSAAARPVPASVLPALRALPDVSAADGTTRRLPAAQRLFGRPGQYDTIVVKAVPGVSPARLRAEVARILPAGVQAVTAASASAAEARQLNSQLGILTTFFAAFAGVAMFVGAFV